MSEKTEKVTNEINSEQFNWLTSIPEEYAQVVMKTMQKRNLKLVWHEDQHQYVLTPDDSKKEMEARIKEITRDIESYKEAIENTEGAIVEAERELDEILEACYADELAEQEPFPDA